MEPPNRHVLDDMETPGGHVLLVGYREHGTVWVGVDRVDSRLSGAIGVRTGSYEQEVVGSVNIGTGWAIGWGVVASDIVRAEFRNDEGEAFPAKILPLPADLEREYRAVWCLIPRCRERCELIGYDGVGRRFDQEDPRPSGPAPNDLDRLAAIHSHLHDTLRYYATAYLIESEENRDRLRSYLHIAANVMALLEAKSLDTRSMLARRSKIVNRYLRDAEVDPWKPPPPPSPES